MRPAAGDCSFVGLIAADRCAKIEILRVLISTVYPPE
jgi:hypothetical protein